MPVFLTKKQKAEMRVRRRKKRQAGAVNKPKDDQAESSSKEKHVSGQSSQVVVNGVHLSKKSKPTAVDHPDTAHTDINKNWDKTAVSHPQTIVVPSHLRGKGARKFRKDARRKARLEGRRDESLIRFVVEGEEAANENGVKEEEAAVPARKRPKKSFPCINDLLEAHRVEERLKAEETARLEGEAKIPDEVKARYVALDCEMVGTGAEGKTSALARVSVVDWHGTVVLDTFVQVPDRVTDFRTFVSGVTAKDINPRNKAMDLHECRRQVGQLLQKKLLVGHALINDLAALLLSHPRADIRDTARYKPFMRATGTHGGKLRPRKLRDLVKEHLGRDIQVKGQAHDSIDDARATMDLYKCVREKWERELEKKRLRHHK